MDIIPRIVINFTDKCNSSCPFCLIPFEETGINDVALLKRIVDRSKELGAKIITFGGGDPFSYCYLPELLEYTFDNVTFIHVDTNTIGITNEHINSIRKYVNVMGLPLEGSESIHNVMRGKDHYSTVLYWLRELHTQRISIKINTVLTKINYCDLDYLAVLLHEYSIKKWSIYQFWGLAAGKINREKYYISSNKYEKLVNELIHKYPDLNIETNKKTSRHFSYFLVSHTGNVYCMQKKNQDEYVVIGSIFDNDIINKWKRHGDIEALNNRAKIRK